jgi:DNA polymerase (family 10)
LFSEIGDILEIKGEPPYRFNAYRTGARSVGAARERLDVLFEQGRLRELKGVGAALEAKIVEYLKTGRIESHEEARRDFPVALASLLRVPGLGPGRARAIYQDLGISTLPDLEDAARTGRLREVPGFGPKAVETLLHSLEQLKQRSARGLISDAWAAFAQIREAVGDEYLAVVGSTRRMQDTVGGLDLLAGRDDAADAEAVLQTLSYLPNLVQVLDRSADEINVQLYGETGGLEVHLSVEPREAWGSALAWYTGSRKHVARLEALARERGWELSSLGLEESATGKLLERQHEAAIYERLGLPWIPPELREDEGEIEAAQAGSLPKLVELADIRGDLHTHTNWTDGTETLEDMAKTAKARGYEYMALTDHTQNLAMTRGLTPDRLNEQRALVKRVNQKLAPFVVLHGTEMDILMDGQLDFPDDLLRSLDYVSASVHTGFRQTREVMTERMRRAVSNRLVNTLNHPHGRIIRRREGYAVDMQAVVEQAASVGCALELNATPDRLDLNGAWARRALQLGARFTVSSDAHNLKELDFMQFGVASARRGWLTATDILNTRPLAELRQLLTAAKPKKPSPPGRGLGEGAVPSSASPLGSPEKNRYSPQQPCGPWVRRCVRHVWTRACHSPTRRAIPASAAATSRRSSPRTMRRCRRPCTPAAFCGLTPNTSASIRRPWLTCISQPRAASRARPCAPPCRTWPSRARSRCGRCCTAWAAWCLCC